MENFQSFSNPDSDKKSVIEKTLSGLEDLSAKVELPDFNMQLKEMLLSKMESKDPYIKGEAITTFIGVSSNPEEARKYFNDPDERVRAILARDCLTMTKFPEEFKKFFLDESDLVRSELAQNYWVMCMPHFREQAKVLIFDPSEMVRNSISETWKKQNLNG